MWLELNCIFHQRILTGRWNSPKPCLVICHPSLSRPPPVCWKVHVRSESKTNKAIRKQAMKLRTVAYNGYGFGLELAFVNSTQLDVMKVDSSSKFISKLWFGIEFKSDHHKIWRSCAINEAGSLSILGRMPDSASNTNVKSHAKFWIRLVTGSCFVYQSG